MSKSLYPSYRQESVSIKIYTKYPPQIVIFAAPYSKNKKPSLFYSTENTPLNLSNSLHPTPKTRSCQHPNLHKTSATICQNRCTLPSTPMTTHNRLNCQNRCTLLQKQEAVTIQIYTKHPPQFVFSTYKDSLSLQSLCLADR